MIYAKFIILGSVVCSPLHTCTCVYSSIPYKSFSIPRSSTVSSTRLTCPLARFISHCWVSLDRKNRPIPTIARVVCSEISRRKSPTFLLGSILSRRQCASTLQLLQIQGVYSQTTCRLVALWSRDCEPHSSSTSFSVSLSSYPLAPSITSRGFHAYLCVNQKSMVSLPWWDGKGNHGQLYILFPSFVILRFFVFSNFQEGRSYSICSLRVDRRFLCEFA